MRKHNHLGGVVAGQQGVQLVGLSRLHYPLAPSIVANMFLVLVPLQRHIANCTSVYIHCCRDLPLATCQLQ